MRGTTAALWHAGRTMGYEGNINEFPQGSMNPAAVAWLLIKGNCIVPDVGIFEATVVCQALFPFLQGYGVTRFHCVGGGGYTVRVNA